MTDSATDSSHTVLVAGTASHVGKSTVVTGFCRYLVGASGTISGDEIHLGETTACAPVAKPFPEQGARGGAATANVFGTSLHRLFENTAVRESFLEAVFAGAGRTRPECDDDCTSPYDRAATLLEEHIDWSPFDFESH